MRAFFILLFSCVSCLAQFGIEQPFFSKLSQSSGPSQTDLVVWFKPETLSGTNGQPTGGWIDSTPSQQNVSTTALDVDKPKLINNLLDGYPGILFGLNGNCYYNWQTNNGGVDLLRNVAGASFYAVVQFTNQIGAQEVFTFTTGDSLTKHRLSFINYQSAPLRRFSALSLDADTANTGYASVDGTFPENVWYLLDGTCSYTGRVHTAWTNGVQMLTHADTFTAANTSDTASAYARLGATLHGYIVEFMLYTTNHDGATRRGIETNYFKAKYPSIAIQ